MLHSHVTFVLVPPFEQVELQRGCVSFGAKRFWTVCLDSLLLNVQSRVLIHRAIPTACSHYNQWTYKVKYFNNALLKY